MRRRLRRERRRFTCKAVLCVQGKAWQAMATGIIAVAVAVAVASPWASGSSRVDALGFEMILVTSRAGPPASSPSYPCGKCLQGITIDMWQGHDH